MGSGRAYALRAAPPPEEQKAWRHRSSARRGCSASSATRSHTFALAGDAQRGLRRAGAAALSTCASASPPAEPAPRRSPRRGGSAWAGVNLTVPHKEAVLPLLDRLTPPGGRRIGAVNTIDLHAAAGCSATTPTARLLRVAARRHVRLRGRPRRGDRRRRLARAPSRAALVDAGVRRHHVANRTPRARRRRWRASLRSARAPRRRAARRAEHAATARRRRRWSSTPRRSASPARAFPLRLAATPARLPVRRPGLRRAADAFLAPPRRAGRPTLDGTGMLLHQGALAFERLDRPPRAAARRWRTRSAHAGLALTRPVTAVAVRPRRPPTR